MILVTKNKNSELPEKRKAEEDAASNLLLRPSAIPAPKSSLGLFKPSALAAPDISTVRLLYRVAPSDSE